MRAPRFAKAAPELVAAFDRALPAKRSVERRLMFGYPSAFLNGNMFAGVFADRIFVRLPPDQRAELLRLKGAGLFEPTPGRPMKDYMVVPTAMHGRPRELATWIDRASRHTAALPAKTKKRP